MTRRWITVGNDSLPLLLIEKPTRQAAIRYAESIFNQHWSELRKSGCKAIPLPERSET